MWRTAEYQLRRRCPAELPRYKMPTKLRCTKTHSGRKVWYVSCRFPARITCNNYLLCWKLQHYSACLWITPISVATISQVQMIGLTPLSNHQSFIAVSCHHSGGPKPQFFKCPSNSSTIFSSEWLSPGPFSFVVRMPKRPVRRGFGIWRFLRRQWVAHPPNTGNSSANTGKDQRFHQPKPLEKDSWPKT